MKSDMGHLKILVVDDDPVLRQKIVSNLRNHRYLVVGAENGSEAWELFKAGHFDLVITDIQMPFGDGLWLLTKIKTEGPVVPVIMMTGGSRVTREEAHALGAAELLSKPFSIKALRDHINDLISV